MISQISSVQWEFFGQSQYISYWLTTEILLYTGHFTKIVDSNLNLRLESYTRQPAYRELIWLVTLTQNRPGNEHPVLYLLASHVPW